MTIDIMILFLILIQWDQDLPVFRSFLLLRIHLRISYQNYKIYFIWKLQENNKG